MHAIIVGGGIGGLTTALMLHARGISCAVYEQAEAVRELGVGINTLPHAIKELKELGLLKALDRVAVRTSELFYMNRLGQVVWHEPRGLDAGYDVPQFSVHRGRLQKVIHAAVRRRLGKDAVHTNCRLTAFKQTKRGVSAEFRDRKGRIAATAHGDLLIGADGIHSTVRGAMYPNEGSPRWKGIMLWRGATDWPSFFTGRSMIIAGGIREKAVIYPIGVGSEPGRNLTNWAILSKVSDGRTRRGGKIGRAPASPPSSCRISNRSRFPRSMSKPW